MTTAVSSAANARSGAALGLSQEEAGRVPKTIGPNTMSDTAVHPWRNAIGKLWAPIRGCSKPRSRSESHLVTEVAVIAGLLVFNAAPSEVARLVRTGSSAS